VEFLSESVFFYCKPNNRIRGEASAEDGADSHSSSQKIPRLSWDLQLHYRVHKSAPLLHILSHLEIF